MPFEKGVAVIGAGLSGLSMALFFHQHNTRSTIYEVRVADVTSPGGIMLSPNALKTLATLGVYERLRANGYHFRNVTFNTNEHKLVEVYEMGNEEKYGYDAFRVFRQLILDELKAMVREAGIQVMYERKFTGIVSEDDSGVRIGFSDGEELTFDLVIGADGIHSAVRRHLHAEVKPVFSNIMAVTSHIPTAAVKVPASDYPMPVSLLGPAGAFVLAPQNPQGSELLGGIQYRTHERSRQEWDALAADKAQLYQMYREHYDSWNDMVKSAIDAVPLHTLNIWPFYMVPHMDTWFSEKGRVIILGDAAHGIPPVAGQGVNQALEDVHSLALLMAAVSEGKADWNESVEWWVQYRQARVARTIVLTEQMNKRRMPGWKPDGDEAIDSSWLFSVDIERDVRTWVEGTRAASYAKNG